ncbi:metallophosphoesterase family protein [Prosthecobacter dejongeii]|uniref:DNA repair exonuclease SbcCD nuclease subunit n=1 Tax=Prosthecobacter dejongeii TaxID=48465 RepID=A0A7W7YKV2_9BACT|nr:DNA repair exonuclease [Prosthecobacter dejongeii]MBB5037897.1 DNA repair exonuclease SbcCD nuclease subunit [Prosthecobacter dejongeii]
MSLTFLHTADWQIGKPFARIEDEQKRAIARQERVRVIERLGQVAQDKEARFMVVAGDVFDSPTPDKGTVSAACAAIGQLGLPVYVIPGNHDHGGPGSLWGQAFFLQEQRALAPNLHVLLKAEPVELEDVVLLPCPLLRQHDASDTTAWIRGLDLSVWQNKPRLIIAHGSVQDFGPGGDEEEAGDAANRLDLARLPLAELDYVALGDWHGMKKVSPAGPCAAWYSGTPEPDRFPRGEGNLPGNVLAVTVERGTPAQVLPISTARLTWHDVEFHLTDDAAVKRLEDLLPTLVQGRTGQDLLRLTLQGSLGISAWGELERVLETWRSRLLRLRLHSRVGIDPSEDEIAGLLTRADAPLAARVASRLLEESQSPEATVAERARQSLLILHAALTRSSGGQ